MIMEKICASNFFAVTVSGDCQSGNDIHSHDILLINPRKYPERGDVCACSVDGKQMIKEYAGTMNGYTLVNTHYADHIMQQGFFAQKIFGTAYACYTPLGVLRWEKDITDRANEPSKVDTILPENCCLA